MANVKLSKDDPAEVIEAVRKYGCLDLALAANDFKASAAIIDKLVSVDNFDADDAGDFLWQLAGNLDADTGRLLIQHGADANAVDSNESYPNGISVAGLAAHNGNISLIQALQQDGLLDVAQARTDGARPLLSIALEAGHLELGQYLLDHGASIDACSLSGMTALHYACEACVVDSITWLIRHGCDCDIEDAAGATAEQYLPPEEDPGVDAIFDMIGQYRQARANGRGGDFVIPADVAALETPALPPEPDTDAVKGEAVKGETGAAKSCACGAATKPRM